MKFCLGFSGCSEVELLPEAVFHSNNLYMLFFLTVNCSPKPSCDCLPASLICQLEIDEAVMWRKTLNSAKHYILGLAARAIPH